MVGAAGGAAEAPKTYGWRGNWTGLYPEAEPPLEWGRIQKGVVAGTTCQAARPSAPLGPGPAEGAKPSGQPIVRDGMIRDWLVVGPFPVEDPVKDFAKEPLPDAPKLQPAEGDRAPGSPRAGERSGDGSGELAWKRYELKKKADYERWGSVELEWVDLTEPLGYKPSSFAYAHTYLHCTRPGKVTFVVDHYISLKVWLNGEVLYAQPKEASGYGSHYGISRQKLAFVHYRSPKFEMTLKEGWNQLLVRVGSPPMALKEWRNQKFTHCLLDSEPVYEEKNIVWMTKMPERTNACPIVVGDRIFTPAEPDELLCLDKATGKILWRRLNNFYDAIPEAERAANPIFKEQIDPLAKELAETTDYEKGLELRRKIRDALLGIDKKQFKLKLEGHLEGHFGIVGFTTTPVSDGKHVWAYYGFGVVACYDLDGNRKWIKRLTTPDDVSYSCSPALIGGRLAVIFNGLYGLDAATGEAAWSDPKARGIASLLPARIRGTDIVTTYRGQFYRVSDGKLLWANPHIIPNDTGWAPGVFIGDTFYLSWSGIGGLLVEDFSGAAGDAWKPKERHLEVGANHRRPNGEWLDRFTAGSPLILGDTFYGIDQYGVFYALDLKTGKPIYKADTGVDEFHTYNAIGVGASAALGGKHIYVVDNQGTCVVIEPGPAYKPVATNRIETVVDRDWPWCPQEILANGPPVFDGKRLYLRGEQYLYCIGEK
jgi:outer membrane protein assembly factor BamB